VILCSQEGQIMYIFVIIELPKKATYHLVYQPKISIVTMKVSNLQTDNHIEKFKTPGFTNLSKNKNHFTLFCI
jgi:hypothetical protein